ncbi:MAG TPA: phosphoribosylglycinamide formyltransferase [Herpetosiphonaceae bacterium]|nr:phosphoribosylglycinamide formyltransferase [Herpetosiphonaceae bacterium]
MSLRLVVMISGSGSNLQALIDAAAAGRLDAEIVAVICDQPKAQGIARALAARIPVICVPLARGAAREPWSLLIADLIAPFQPDYVLMAGWMRIMPAAFVERFSPNVLNQHPSLLPDDAGDIYVTSDGREIPAIRGAHAVRDAIALGVPVSGCTVHRVTPQVDVGPVLARAEVPVLPGDSVGELQERIKQAERPMIVAVINRLAAEQA